VQVFSACHSCFRRNDRQKKLAHGVRKPMCFCKTEKAPHLLLTSAVLFLFDKEAAGIMIIYLSFFGAAYGPKAFCVYAFSFSFFAS
jgi:hypothetical protein